MCLNFPNNFRECRDIIILLMMAILCFFFLVGSGIKITSVGRQKIYMVRKSKNINNNKTNKIIKERRGIITVKR